MACRDWVKIGGGDWLGEAEPRREWIGNHIHFLWVKCLLNRLEHIVILFNLKFEDMSDSPKNSQKNPIIEFLWKILLFICGDEKKKINRSVLWAVFNTTATFILLTFTLLQVRQVSRTTKGEVLQKFSENFFKPETRELLMLFEYGLIKFKENNINVDTVMGLPQNFGCFVRANSYPPTLNSFLLDTTKTIFSSYEIDDYVLGHLENLGMYLKMEMVDIEEIYLNYGWYIMLFWEDPEMEKYILWCKKIYKGSASAHYVYSEYLYRQIKRFEKEHPPTYYKRMIAG